MHAIIRNALRIMLLVCVVSEGTVSGSHPTLANQSTSDPNAAAYTQNLLNWLSGLESSSSNKVVIGQYITRQEHNTDGRTAAQAWQYYYHDLHTLTGKYVGIAGFDFSTREKEEQSGPDNKPSDSNWRSYAEEHHDNGGILRLMWHAGNPWNNYSSWSLIPVGHTLSEIITPGNSAYNTWTGWLKELADKLQYYEDNNIPIIGDRCMRRMTTGSGGERAGAQAQPTI
jgi:hypothetical protein